MLWIRIRIHMLLGLQVPDPDPLIRGMDPRIRIHPKMLWIHNAGLNPILQALFQKREGSGSGAGFGPLTNGSGSSRPKNMRILRIRIPNINQKLTIADHIDLFIVVGVAKEADAGGSTAAAAATAVIMAAAAGKWRGGHCRFRHSCRVVSSRPHSSSGHHTPI